MMNDLSFLFLCVQDGWMVVGCRFWREHCHCPSWAFAEVIWGMNSSVAPHKLEVWAKQVVPPFLIQGHASLEVNCCITGSSCPPASLTGSGVGTSAPTGWIHGGPESFWGCACVAWEPWTRVLWLLRFCSGLELLLVHREAVSSDCLIGAVNARVSLLVSMKSRQMPREEHLFLTATWLGRSLALILSCWTARPLFQHPCQWWTGAEEWLEGWKGCSSLMLISPQRERMSPAHINTGKVWSEHRVLLLERLLSETSPLLILARSWQRNLAGCHTVLLWAEQGIFHKKDEMTERRADNCYLSLWAFVGRYWIENGSYNCIFGSLVPGKDL